MLKKIICVGMVFVMCLGLFTGCRNENKNIIWYDVSSARSDLFSPQTEILQIVNSVEELKTAFENGDTLEELTKSFDESYFLDKALILYSYSFSNGADFKRITSIEKVEETIILNVTYFVFKGYTPAVIVFGTYVIEVNKSDVSNATNIEAKIKIKETK